MSEHLTVLAMTAASLGFLHTLFGPDHYLPFLVMSKARGWSRTRTLGITALCGLGHVLGSLMLGAVGIAAGLAVSRMEVLEGVRGDLAAWALIALGFVYAAWGLKQAFRDRTHEHAHAHVGGVEHEHVHTHHQAHTHAHLGTDAADVTPWVLFTVFVLGPCEPLIPLLMVPAAQQSLFGIIVVTAIFSVVTIITMLCTVSLGLAGVDRLPLGQLERFGHAIAGTTIGLCGASIVFLGL
ncbi:MAG: hypothetical protein QF415_02360 [Candidatus Undinarchaeales archaeon]|jgi:sulfite exporter TauE/SafE|nr:hypothetical protein [Candidatus Undinarchaeales archaeon]MDP7492247.1 hypothetical protein [Candidatus Undinarchaeales archaeon]